MIFEPTSGGTGTCTLDGNPDTIIFWAEWTSEPFLGRIVFQTATYLNSSPLQFSYTTDGICKEYQWNGTIWDYVADFTFTAAPPP